ncbi:hypothetical protein GCM10009101_08790 [Brevundimonas lenta]
MAIGTATAALKQRATASRALAPKIQASDAKKARRGGYIAAGLLSLSKERTFPPRNASGRLLRRNAALPE